jgi:hypothetical protein
MDSAAELLDGVLEDQVEAIPVAIVEEDRVAGVAAEDDVVDGAGIMDAGFTGHAGRIAANVRKSNLTPPDPLISCTHLTDKGRENDIQETRRADQFPRRKP